MKLQFDSSQGYQLEAVQSVINVFEGQPLANDDFQVTLATHQAGLAFTDTGVANQLLLSDEQILENVKKVQLDFNERNAYTDDEGTERFFSSIDPNDALIPVKTEDGKELTPLNFTIEMETGTGKTYTYLRTVYELNKTYGFKKFVVVVPPSRLADRVGTRGVC